MDDEDATRVKSDEQAGAPAGTTFDVEDDVDSDDSDDEDDGDPTGDDDESSDDDDDDDVLPSLQARYDSDSESSDDESDDEEELPEEPMQLGRGHRVRVPTGPILTSKSLKGRTQRHERWRHTVRNCKCPCSGPICGRNEPKGAESSAFGMCHGWSRAYFF